MRRPYKLGVDEILDSPLVMDSPSVREQEFVIVRASVLVPTLRYSRIFDENHPNSARCLLSVYIHIRTSLFKFDDEKEYTISKLSGKEYVQNQVL